VKTYFEIHIGAVKGPIGNQELDNDPIGNNRVPQRDFLRKNSDKYNFSYTQQGNLQLK